MLFRLAASPQCRTRRWRAPPPSGPGYWPSGFPPLPPPYLLSVLPRMKMFQMSSLVRLFRLLHRHNVGPKDGEFRLPLVPAAGCQALLLLAPCLSCLELKCFQMSSLAKLFRLAAPPQCRTRRWRALPPSGPGYWPSGFPPLPPPHLLSVLPRMKMFQMSSLVRLFRLAASPQYRTRR